MTPGVKLQQVYLREVWEHHLGGCTHMCGCACVCMDVEARGVTSDVIPESLSTSFETGSLIDLELTK